MSDVMPTCGVVIEKNKQGEKRCPNPAEDVVTLVSPVDLVTVSAVVLLCTHHSQMFDEGKPLILVAENGEHLAIQSGAEQDVTEQSHDEQPDRRDTQSNDGGTDPRGQPC